MITIFCGEEYVCGCSIRPAYRLQIGMDTIEVAMSTR